MSSSADFTTVAQALTFAQSQGLERLDAQLLILHALGHAAHDRAWLLAHDTDTLQSTAQTALRSAVARRVSGEPLAYITGHKEFFGLDLLVDARVLVPRPDTETLVQWALDVLCEPPNTTSSDNHGTSVELVDLGTGSGAIALAMKHARPQWRIRAVDASPDALAVARSNARRLQLEVDFQQGSWLEGVPGRFDAIVSNPPYITDQDPHLAALTHEPLKALASGADGLDDIRAIIAQSPSRLKPGGWLLLEHGYDQAPAVRALLVQAGFDAVQSRQDLAGIERCSGARWQVAS